MRLPGARVGATAVAVVAIGLVAVAQMGLPSASAATPGCNVTWTGTAVGSWNTPGNWSTGTVPGPTSDVCMSKFAIVHASGRIDVHSLRVGNSMTIDFGGGAPASVTIAGALSNAGVVDVNGLTMISGSIANTGTIESQGTSTLNSAAFSNTGSLDVIGGGTLTLTHDPQQLSGGILSGGSLEVGQGDVLVVQQDIAQLPAGAVSLIGPGSAIDDAAGHNALAGLSYVGAAGDLQLAAGASLSIAHGLVSRGTVAIGSQANPGAATLMIAGPYTETECGVTSLENGTLQARGVFVGGNTTVQGSGDIATDVHDVGTVNSFGKLRIAGSFYEGPAGAVGVDAATRSTLTVATAAVLHGALDVSTLTPPPHGLSFTAIMFATRSGLFTSVTHGFHLAVSQHAINVVAN